MFIVYSLNLYLYIQIYFSVFFFEIKKRSLLSVWFFEVPCIKCDADTENILYIVN